MIPDEEAEFRGSGGFIRNIIIIAVLHLIGLAVVLLFALHPTQEKEEQLVWMNPGSFGSSETGGTPAANRNTPEPEEAPETTPENATPTPASTPEQPTPEPTTPPPATPPPAKPPPSQESSELPIAHTPSPTPTPTPRPTPKPTPKPTATPKPTPTAKPSPKPTPKPTPKAQPSPKPTPKATVSSKPKESGSSTPTPSGAPKPKSSSEGTQEAKNSPTEQKKHGEATGNKSERQQHPGSGNGEGNEHGNASGKGEADIGMYAEVIKNRFQSAWNQPHGEIPGGTTLVVNVRLKIQPDGTVTEFTIVEGSGNAVVDDSVREAGQKIAKLPPPPGGGTFTPIIRFELGD